MGIYANYLDQKFTMEQLAAERKLQLSYIAAKRKRDVLVIA